MSAQDFLVSASAAGVAHLIHHPLYTLKSQMMYYGPKFSFIDFFNKAAHQPRGFLYRGVFSRTIGIMPEKAFKMQGWIIVGRMMEKHFDQPTYIKWLVAGAAAGAATTIIGCPSERVMVLAQIQKQGFLTVLRQTGLKGLYNGWTATLYRDISFNASFFTLREMFVRQYTAWTGEQPRAFKRVALGLPAGCLASVVACPFDVIKTRMQGSSLGSKYRTFYRVFVDVVRQDGPRSLMKGLGPRLIAVPSMMSVFYVINEEFEKLILH